MAVKLYKPTTPGRRGMTSRDFSEITAKKPLKSLIKSKKTGSGRNNKGRITVRHKGGGVKRFYRNVDFRLPAGLKAKVKAIEYDPNRTANIARIVDQEGKNYYVVAVSGLKVGSTIETGEEVAVKNGNKMQLKNMPIGSFINNIEIEPGQGSKLVRSAGASAQLSAREGNYAQIKMPSGEVRMVRVECYATLGTVGNVQHQNIKYGSAGRKRKMGIRPTVRGVVMNAADHPHGGGDGGKHGIGGGKNHGAAPRTPWGQKTLGYKTRTRKSTNKYIVRSRHESKRR